MGRKLKQKRQGKKPILLELPGGRSFQVHHDRTIYEERRVTRKTLVRITDELTLQEVATHLRATVDEQKARDEEITANARAAEKRIQARKAQRADAAETDLAEAIEQEEAPGAE